MICIQTSIHSTKMVCSKNRNKKSECARSQKMMARRLAAMHKLLLTTNWLAFSALTLLNYSDAGATNGWLRRTSCETTRSFLRKQISWIKAASGCWKLSTSRRLDSLIILTCYKTSLSVCAFRIRWASPATAKNYCNCIRHRLANRMSNHLKKAPCSLRTS